LIKICLLDSPFWNGSLMDSVLGLLGARAAPQLALSLSLAAGISRISAVRILPPSIHTALQRSVPQMVAQSGLQQKLNRYFEQKI
jgi:hypothetical protein